MGKRHIAVSHSNMAHFPSHQTGKTERKQTRPVKIKVENRLALPVPRIDLEEHTRLMQALRHNPVLLFTSPIQQALQHEVEYHQPQARWAAHLLKLLARYDRQHRKNNIDAAAITARHIAWQEQMAKV